MSRSRAGAAALLTTLGLVAACGGQPAGGAPAAPAPTTTAAAAPTSTAAPASCATRTYDRLSEEQRFAQLVVIGVPAGGISPAARTALGLEPGGIILTDGESASADAVTKVVTGAQATGGGEVPLLVSADQEGGQVQELEGPGFPTMPTALVQGRDADGLRAQAKGWGEALRDVGVTVNLAPVADVVNPALGEANAPVGKFDRQYGDDVPTASAGVRAFVGGMRDADVAPTLKHFPGLGEVRQNTDFAGGVVDSTTGPDSPSLQSFAAGIEAGAPLVMMSSARYAKIDPDNQALFSSRVMQDVLRDRLKFTGVVMTDDVGAAAALEDTPVGARATKFLAAGGDLVLTIRPGDLAPMLDAITAAAREPAFAERAHDAVRRVLALKEQRGILTC
ncbi:glycoside hydrolase family 3 N-terminal domain-containing protein [Actinomycetospora termitidis]|uniref:beta-N-acetylhexosaminidase n=1 Tax=Actinomycetospora termitidis TaxID=3053470 RepID=A0ABT7M987_9PSEU|nr:glycoside hydrolase family 3 N-terminal domain-containing protein [Actinomycetospora sp. Odt1-22]MDL5157234.1 glycoside hydrolase family 3 N-terminal domain-containing protein [Actinomycetospora sp. Odt1-22]